MPPPASAIAILDPDTIEVTAIAHRLDFADHAAEVPTHTHRKAQLILASHGAVTCIAADNVWIVPPNCAIWIPGGVPHSARATPNARVDYLFVEPGASVLPTHCCALELTPLIRMMIDRLAIEPCDYSPDGHAARLARVMLDELAMMPRQRFNLPVSDDTRIRAIAEALTTTPSDRSTLADWARRVAMSERSLARLMVRETGLTFGRWRQQLHLVVALRDLATGTKVQHVAANLGYESVNAFILMFHKAIGSTPSRYLRGISERSQDHQSMTVS
jgi:AraC-like DNA-binding protein